MQIIANKYDVLRQIGRGGMGVVYQVRHRTLETTLALKMLPAELALNDEIVRRFHQEARVMAQLQHPNIVRVLDVDRDADTHYFVMEYIEGHSLSQHLQERGPLSVPEAGAIARQVVQALEYAHQYDPPVIHRDIKPDNILIEAHSKRAVVTDFGIAKVIGAGAQTRAGLLLGTLLYCAPEQILQEEGPDGRADLYSLGLVMYEMAANRPFFANLDERALLSRVLYGPDENVPTFSEPLAPEYVSVISRAIARDRDCRYQQAGDMLRDIEACLGLQISTTPNQHLEGPSCMPRAATQTCRAPETKHSTGKLLFQSWARKRSVPVWITAGCFLLALTGWVCVHYLQPRADEERTEHTERTELIQTASVSPLPQRVPKRGWEDAQGRTSAPFSPSLPVSSELHAIKWTFAPPAPVEAPDSTLGAEELQPAEQPVSPPRGYQVTTLTAVRTGPTWSGKEVTWLKPRTRIQVVAINGNWLKVTSRANPPKPPGYVWKDDARPNHSSVSAHRGRKR